mmetsp:Transcript_23320/g.32616  ORF Transcript_23320/g.32616 Transcript_23320/m.32616 type:complete len:216 (-) Transcript_23320:59-706(-)
MEEHNIEPLHFCAADVSLDEAEEGGEGLSLHGGLDGELKQMVDDGSGEEPCLKIDTERELYPYAIVWGPLPCITWCLPCVGHMGIGDSTGRVHDFAGPYCVNTNRFMTGRVVRYWQLEKHHIKVLSERGDPAKVWDRALAEGDRKYSGLMHNICCQNCHHHTSQCARNAGLRIGWFQAAVLVLLKGSSVSWDRTAFAFGPFILLFTFILLMSLLT